MPEWLKQSIHDAPEVSGAVLAVRLVAAFLFGCVVAGIYRGTRQPSEGQQSFLATLVLLSVLIAMVTLVIGSSVARAFSLVGALAIVRFRTVVEDTRDTAFVIFAVVVGMAAGAGFFAPALVGAPFVALAALLFRPRPVPAPVGHVLAVRLGTGVVPDALLKDTFTRFLDQAQLVSTTTARQGAALELTYAVRLRQVDNAVALVAELNRLEGVQNVELRQA
jgi:hypothetical protein